MKGNDEETERIMEKNTEVDLKRKVIRVKHGFIWL
jgi:hypothetical protein